MKTYSELLQIAYFKAARDLYRVAALVLNDCTRPEEFRGSTAEWAKTRSKAIATQARALEEQGHEQAIATQRQETALAKARAEHSDAITRHIRLLAEYNS